MPFEVFARPAINRGGRRPHPDPIVTVAPRGDVLLNQAAARALWRPAAVVFLHDPGAGLIGLRAAARDDPNAYALTTPTRGSAKTVATAFVRHVGLDRGPTRRYPARLEGGVLVVALGGGA